jgi:hypothetical protein
MRIAEELVINGRVAGFAGFAANKIGASCNNGQAEGGINRPKGLHYII